MYVCSPRWIGFKFRLRIAPFEFDAEFRYGDEKCRWISHGAGEQRAWKWVE